MLGWDTEVTGIDLFHNAKPYIVTTCDEEENQRFWIAEVDPLTREPQWQSDDLLEIKEMILEAPETVGQNPNYDVMAMENIIPEFSNWNWETTFDTVLADHLLKSNRRHDLTTQALVYLRKRINKYEDAVEKATQEARRICRSRYKDWMIAKEGLPCMPSAKETVWKMDMWLPRAIALEENYPDDHPWWDVTTDYANIDSACTIAIFFQQKQKLEELDLWEIYLERLKVMRQRHDMQKRGITVSKKRLEELETEYTEESERATAICTTIAEGYDFALELPKNGMNKSLTEFAFNVMKLPVVKKTDTGKPSLDKIAIEEYQATLPERSKELLFINTLSGKRSRDTARGFMSAYKRYWFALGIDELDEWYRLHPSLNPTGTDTLRWSSKAPNEQQISKKEGFNIRYAFGPAPGREWWSLDYQNVELRIPAYEANERVMIDLFEKPDEAPYFGSNHLFSASIVYPELFWPLADQKGAFKKKYAATFYQWIKNFNFAIQYGSKALTANRAAHKKGAYESMKSKLTRISDLDQHCIDYANKYGYVETIPDKELGHKRGYPLYCTQMENGKVLETVPLNYHVQGTACWVMMRAMSKVQDFLNTLDDAHIALQVHDELIFDLPYVPNRGNLPKIRTLRRIMESLGDSISTPLTVGVEYHEHNWSVGVAC